MAPNAQDTTTAPPTPDAPTSLDLIVADLQSKGYKVTNADAYKGNYFQYRPKDVPKLDDDMDAPTEGVPYCGTCESFKCEHISAPTDTSFGVALKYANEMAEKLANPPTDTGWEQRFEKEFEWAYTDNGNLEIHDSEIIKFIRTLLAEQKARMVEEVEGMKDEQLANAEGLMDDETRALKLVAIVKNQVCDSIIKALSK